MYPYMGWVAEAIKRMKYGDEYDRSSQLGPLMAGLVASFGRIDALVPVPLHLSRFNERGYNQSELLARHISEHTGIPVKPMLLRTVPTAPQVRLSLEERRANVRTAFQVSDQWAPAVHDRLLLVDDVRTSGATLNACVDALIEASCGPVSALTFAIDLRPRELASFIDREKSRG